MKTVYADVVLCINFLVDYILLYLAGYFLHIKIKKRLLVLSSLAGAAYSLVCQIFSVDGIFAFFISSAYLFFMVKIALGKQNIRLYVKSWIYVFTLSVVLSGTVNLVMFNFASKSYPSSLLLPICTFLMFFVLKLIGNIFSKTIKTKTVDAEIKIAGISHQLILLCDSGNLLYDLYTSLPVIVIGKNVLPQHDVEISKPRLMPVNTVESHTLLPVITPESIVINHREILAVVGVSTVADNFNGYDGIVPQNLVQNI